MIKIEINNSEFIMNSNISVLEACKYVGITIPRFCYHESLSIAGNCRMCLVEILNLPKPVASCAQPVMNNLKIFTDTPLIKKARENILEILLLNHPLDCPICDQGGECDLQDQTKIFGGDHTRFFFNKRSVEDKYCGPLIKTIMTRCIHCTRCVRFYNEISGFDYLGTLNRGSHTEIGSYVYKNSRSEISGNVIDLCPVGALTSKPYAFKSRPWELRTTESVDLSDGLGSNIYFHYKETQVLRVMPKINSNINESIISDKARFSFDGLQNNRLDKIFKESFNKFKEQNWNDTLKEIKFLLKKEENRILFLIDSELDLKSLSVIKSLINIFGNNKIKIKSIGNKTKSVNFQLHCLNNKISCLTNKSKFCFFLSTNIRIENAILNSKIRKKISLENLIVFSSGISDTHNLGINYINLNSCSISTLLEGKNENLSKFLVVSKNPIIFIGESLTRIGWNSSLLIQIIKNIIPTAILLDIKLSCNSKGLEFLNIKPVNKKIILNSSVIIGLNLNENFMSNKIIDLYLNKNRFSYLLKNKLIWINTHGSNLALKANLSIPSLSELEEEKIFLNLENKPQKTNKVFPMIGNSRTIRGLFSSCIINRKAKIEGKYLSFLLEIINKPELFLKTKAKLLLNKNFLRILNKNKFKIQNDLIKPIMEDFYISNNTSKNSITMAKCSQELRTEITNF